jgi:hypothetical protein
MRKILLAVGVCLLITRTSSAQYIGAHIDRLNELVASKKKSAENAENESLSYGWNMFLYVNWPAKAGPADRGVPNTARPFGKMGTPVVWTTWKSTAEVYRLAGTAPEPWTTAEPVPPEVASVKLPPADNGDNWQRMTDDVQVDGFNLLDSNDQKILYEIRMNAATFGSIVSEKLYNVQGQMQRAAAKGALDFPFNAMEVKAAWRWIDPKDKGTACDASHYFTTKGYAVIKDNNGDLVGYRTGLMGLTGLHIITKALDQWVWITFEQVDNSKCTKVKRQIRIAGNVGNTSQAPKADIKGTRWENYEMVGVQTSEETAGQPILLANTQIESQFQTRSSCMTCHALSSVAASKPADPTVPIRRSFVDASASPPYFIGPPPSLGMYKFQDYVWSLRKAFWLPAAAGKENP